MVPGKESHPNQSVESKLARFGHGRSAGQITVKRFLDFARNDKKLIYYEYYSTVHEAIAREKQLKKWSRAKKIALINRFNPSWPDLGMDVLQDR
jgi:predicted GIY-YIG superfamily endonuclease